MNVFQCHTIEENHCLSDSNQNLRYGNLAKSQVYAYIAITCRWAAVHVRILKKQITHNITVMINQKS